MHRPAIGRRRDEQPEAAQRDVGDPAAAGKMPLLGCGARRLGVVHNTEVTGVAKRADGVRVFRLDGVAATYLRTVQDDSAAVERVLAASGSA